MLPAKAGFHHICCTDAYRWAMKDSVRSNDAECHRELLKTEAEGRTLIYYSLRWFSLGCNPEHKISEVRVCSAGDTCRRPRSLECGGTPPQVITYKLGSCNSGQVISPLYTSWKTVQLTENWSVV